jgi:Icc-related predicted phosphoesterase
MKYWNKIPSSTDILITHGPPIGHGDLSISNQRTGCAGLLRVVQERVKPALHVFGHIHEGAGVTTDGQTIFVNASTCNVRYQPSKLNPPIYVDICKQTKKIKQWVVPSE